MKRFTRLPSVFGGVALLVFATQAFGDSAPCGPGPDWVSSCGGGLYSLSTTSNFNLWLDLNGNQIQEGNTVGGDWVGFVQTTGTTKINLASSGGSRQMLSDVYQLSETGPDGAKVIAGAGMDSSLYSPGAITARDGSTPSFCDPAAGTRGTDLSLADSCYDVFFQLTTPASLGSVILHNTSPLRVLCEGLKGVPPFGCQYKWNQQVLFLYGTADNITVRGALLPGDATHHNVPESAAAPQLVGMLLLGALTLRRARN